MVFYCVFDFKFESHTVHKMESIQNNLILSFWVSQRVVEDSFFQFTIVFERRMVSKVGFIIERGFFVVTFFLKQLFFLFLC
jgi:hypothetical protein